MLCILLLSFDFSSIFSCSWIHIKHDTLNRPKFQKVNRSYSSHYLIFLFFFFSNLGFSINVLGIFGDDQMLDDRTFLQTKKFHNLYLQSSGSQSMAINKFALKQNAAYDLQFKVTHWKTFNTYYGISFCFLCAILTYGKFEI